MVGVAGGGGGMTSPQFVLPQVLLKVRSLPGLCLFPGLLGVGGWWSCSKVASLGASVPTGWPWLTIGSSGVSVPGGCPWVTVRPPWLG